MAAQQSRTGRRSRTFLLPPCTARKRSPAQLLAHQLGPVATAALGDSSRQTRASVAALTRHIWRQHQTHLRSIQLLQQVMRQAADSRQAMAQTATSSRHRSPFWTCGQQQVHLAMTHKNGNPSNPIKNTSTVQAGFHRPLMQAHSKCTTAAGRIATHDIAPVPVALVLPFCAVDSALMHTHCRPAASAAAAPRAGGAPHLGRPAAHRRPPCSGCGCTRRHGRETTGARIAQGSRGRGWLSDSNAEPVDSLAW
jgi:hypothetical protein